MICIGTDAGSKSFTIYGVNEAKKIIFKGEIRPAGAGSAGTAGWKCGKFFCNELTQ